MKDKEELIKHIAEQLREHEEGYVDGAWENFVAHEKKDRKILPLFWTAAACIILLFGSGIFYYMHEHRSLPNQSLLVKDYSAQKNIASHDSSHIIADNITGNTNINSVNISSANATGNQGFATNKSSYPHFISNNIIDDFKTNTIDDNMRSATGGIIHSDSANKLNTNVAINNNVQNQSKIYQNIIDTNTAQSEKKTDTAKMTYFPKDAMENPDEKTAADFRHWSVDAVLSPSVSNNSNKVNMGYGVAVGYNVTKKVSVNSGVSYLQLTGYSNTSSGGNSSVQANVTGISIPLELRYHLSQKIYINAGASALAVLSNKQQTNFVAANIVSDAFTARNGITVAGATVLDKPVSTAVAGSQTKNANQNLAGFFNFSVGMKQKLGTNTNFSIEPFVSVPMNGNFNRQNIHLTNAGVRIKFGL